MADQVAICCRSAGNTAFEFAADAAYLTTLPEEAAEGVHDLGAAENEPASGVEDGASCCAVTVGSAGMGGAR